MGESLIRRVARIPVRAARLAVHRCFHPARARAAAETVGRVGVPQSVLFVCHGNICRSPYAAAAFARRSDSAGLTAVDVESAGFIGPNRAAPREAITTAAQRGIDLSRHRSKLLTADLVSRAALIVVMDGEQRERLCARFGPPHAEVLVLGDFDEPGSPSRTILDPFGHPPEIFADVYGRIDRCLDNLLEAMQANHGGGRQAIRHSPSSRRETGS